MKGVALYAQVSGSHPDDYIAQCAPLVKRIAWHLMARLPPSVQVDDLIQAGMLGLLEAARRFDPAQGAAFATFAEPRIRGAMFDEIRKGDWTPRSVHRKVRQLTAAIHTVEARTGSEASDTQIAAEMAITLAEYHQLLNDLRGHKLVSLEESRENESSEIENIAASNGDPVQWVDQEALTKNLATAIDRLPERERLVLSLYYDEELNLKEIGAVLGVSESRISQIHSQAVARLRAKFAD